MRSEGHENDEADDTIEYSGRAAEQVRSEHSAVDSKTPLNPRNKVLHFRITFNGLGYASKISVGKFIDVAPQVKLLIGIAQASDDRYQFDGADESRKKTFALKMLNKGMQPEKCLGEPELEEMIVSAIEEGMLCMNGNGLELTADGMQVIRADKTLNSRR